MIIIIALLMIIWAMIFCAKQFMQYWRIEKLYTNNTMAKVVKMTYIEPAKKRDIKRYNVILQYTIDGKVGRSEIVVPYTKADAFQVGKEVSIRYTVSGNGAVHIASNNDMTRKLMIAYASAIAIEFIVFFIIWWRL